MTIGHLSFKLWIFSGHIARSEFWKFRILEFLNFHPCSYETAHNRPMLINGMMRFVEIAKYDANLGTRKKDQNAFVWRNF